MTNEEAIQVFSGIKKARHDAHVCNNADNWIEYINNLIEEYNELINEYDLPVLLISGFNPDATISGDCEDYDCTGDCELCQQEADDLLHKYKEKYNTIIEEWLLEVEEKYELDENTIAPSGMARYNWIMSY
jgi:hypothetical protein